MIGLPERLIDYTHARAAGVSPADAHELLIRALERVQRAPADRHHWRNAASALALAVLITGSLVLLQLHSAPSKGPVATPAIILPDEVIQLLARQQVQSFRIRDRRLSPPQPAWMVADNSQLVITTTNYCETTVFQVVDPRSGNDLRAPVRLTGCFDNGFSPLWLPDGTILLEHHKLTGTAANVRAVPLGLDRYDWRAGRVIQTYPVPFPRDQVLAPDKEHVYVLTASVSGVTDCGDSNCPSIVHDTIDVLDLRTATIAAQFDAGSHTRFDFGIENRVAVSADGRSLYVNESSELLVFDSQRPGPPTVMPLNGPQATRPGWLWPGGLVTAEAKEVAGNTIAVDPRGRWVAILGTTSDQAPFGPPNGLWLVSTTGAPRVVWHVHAHDGFRAIASSLDGSALYLIEVAGGGRYVLVVDPITGKDVADLLVCSSTRCDGFDGITGVSPASQ
jgi:DNA-binding beta-propeller fold protein YncE